jgi:hypothetical protein
MLNCWVAMAFPSKDVGKRCRIPTRMNVKGNEGFTAVRLKVEENQLVDAFGEIGFLIAGLKGA